MSDATAIFPVRHTPGREVNEVNENSCEDTDFLATALLSVFEELGCRSAASQRSSAWFGST